MREAQQLQAPVLPANSELAAATTELLEDDAHLECVRALDRSFATQAARDLFIGESRLERIDLSATRLNSLSMRDVILDYCNLANANWERPFLKRSVFQKCRLTGWTTNEARFENVMLRDCSAQYAGFIGARFNKVRFEKCIFMEADFENSDLSGVVFSECDLIGAQFSGARMAKTDLRTSKIDRIIVGPAELRGAIVEPEQAVMVAELLGLTVA